MRRAFVLACMAILSCTPEPPTTTEPRCPEPLADAPIDAPPPDVTPEQPPAEPRPPTDDDDDEITARMDYNDLTITLRVDEVESTDDEDDEDDEDDADDGIVRITIQTESGESATLERPAEFDECWVGQLEAEIKVIYGDEEELVLDAKYSCVMAEAVVRRSTTHHLILAIETTTPAMRELYAGISRASARDHLVVKVDKLEFYVEAQTLAVYRHSVAWCDKPGLIELFGPKASCSSSARRLKLVERVPL